MKGFEMFDKIRSKKEQKESVKTSVFSVFVPEDETKFNFDKFIELAGEHDLELVGATLNKKDDLEWMSFVLMGKRKDLYEFDLELPYAEDNEQEDAEED